MNLWYVGLAVVLFLFFLGARVAKWLMWGLAIIIVGFIGFTFFL